jgi:cysteinyl-tRNA synthetase
MRLYNTLNKKIEEFIPNEEGIVRLYTCGPTVYHYAHIGNLRTYIFEDVLEKTLIYIGYNVKRVMNITDVGHLQSDGDTGEDKMLIGAKRENKTVYEIAEYYTESFFNDAEKLNITKPSIVKKASDQITDYIKIIENLIKNDFAYFSNGNVYFDISKAKDYYKLSGKKEEELVVGAREDVTNDESKRNPFDFVLWFTKSKFENQAMIWDSPWGRGYPGWHIECSTIANATLGEYLDIHCGGVDNIFPHHTNEIAQSEAYLGHKWCNYWVHGEHLNDITGKMAKSKGEFLTVSLLIDKGYDPLAYRFMCLQSHYRKQLLFTYESLDIATQSYNKLKSRISSLNNNETIINKEVVDRYKSKYKEALEDNLNTSNALTVLFDVLKDESIDDYNKLIIIEDFDKVLSLNLINNSKEEFSEEINKLIEERNLAKRNKDFAKADEIRNKLYDLGITIKDTRDGTIIERK